MADLERVLTASEPPCRHRRCSRRPARYDLPRKMPASRCWLRAGTQLLLDLMLHRGVLIGVDSGVGERTMLDASKYAEHFPDERQTFELRDTKRAAIPRTAIPSPSALLLAALSRLEREFGDILRAQNSGRVDGAG